MKYPREQVYAALFTLVQKMNTEATPFNLMSRRWQNWAQVPITSLPALFQEEKIEAADQGVARGLTRWKLRVNIWIYLPVDQTLNAVQSTVMNNYKDALEAILQPGSPGPGNPYGFQQTLGGLVQNAFIEGASLMDEGLVSPPAVLVTPITIVSGQ